MKKTRLFWIIFSTFVVVVNISLLILTWYSSFTIKHFFIQQMVKDLKSRAYLTNNSFIAYLEPLNATKIDYLCKIYGSNTSARFTIVLPSGKVIGDSIRNPINMENHKNRPEIIEALSGKVGESVRYPIYLKNNKTYFEIISAFEDIFGESSRYSSTIKEKMLYIAIPAIKNDKILGIIRVSIPITVINHTLKQIYIRNLVGGIFLIIIISIISLFLSRKISRPLEDLEKIADSFAEGNLKHKMLISNIKEIDSLSVTMSTMAIRLKQLENSRKSFVANVSHELRTPIMTIKGFLETLQEGALYNPDEAGRFINITMKHAEHLDAIVEDLLKLSRIQQEAEKGDIFLEEKDLKPVLNSAIWDCSLKSQTKNIKIDLSCEDKLKVNINPVLLQQAVVNLINNAINYSKEDSMLSIDAFKINDEIVIKVKDQGFGIEEQYLSHIFERFYRIDKSKNGTGLGLSIVEDIIKIHKGHITVESEVDIGSTFIIHLPIYER
jgi:signal transduction histidine kinase